MMNLESVTDFKTEVISKNFKLQYLNLFEIVQGGPEIGQISIDDYLIKNVFFGGPILYNEYYIFIPMYVKGVLKRGFRLVKIDVKSKKITKVSGIENLIVLNKIDESFVYYSVDQDRITQKKVKW